MRHTFAPNSIAAVLSLLASTAALATVNHGDYPGTSVDFIAVSETTLSADPEPLWAAPILAGSGDQLAFFPPNFTSACSTALGPNDVTTSELTTTITAHPGRSIDTIMLAENGDVTLTTFPPFGNANTNASAALSGTVTVIEVNGSPIAPVVIPFSGTFTPQSSFALPTNFGTSLWTGSMTVNVSSTVPLASKAVLKLNNHLASNCAPGNSSAKIQKKVVSGPAVAILVNPIECDLELDKTCCVTQPVLPDLDSCDGQLERLLLKYTGDKCSASDNEQGGYFECYGHRRIGENADIWPLSSGLIVTPNDDLDYDDVVELTHSSGVFPSTTKLKVFDSWWRRQYLKINTPAQGDRVRRPVRRVRGRGHREHARWLRGLQPAAGSAGVRAVRRSVGTPCDDHVVDMVFEYQGQACQNPLPNPQYGYAKCTGNATGATNVGIVYTGPYASKQKITPSSGIDNGDLVRITSTSWGGCQELQQLKITDASGVRQKVEFKVSCSKRSASVTSSAASGSSSSPPRAASTPRSAPPGLPVLRGSARTRRPALHERPAGPDARLHRRLPGQGCTVSNPQGGYGTCSGVADPGDPVSVSIEPGLVADPDDLIEFGDLVSITPNPRATCPASPISR